MAPAPLAIAPPSWALLPAKYASISAAVPQFWIAPPSPALEARADQSTWSANPALPRALLPENFAPVRVKVPAARLSIAPPLPEE